MRHHDAVVTTLEEHGGRVDKLQVWQCNLRFGDLAKRRERINT
jgi:hypothetical protein